MLTFVGLEKSTFLLITFKHKWSCFLVFQAPIFCSVGISYLHFLHINANATNILVSISCDLEAMDQEVEHSLIRIFPLLKQILWFLGRLFHERNSQYLELLPQLELFSLYVIVRVIESPLKIYFSVFVLSWTAKTMLISLIDYLKITALHFQYWFLEFS